ncbi:hypothetical protein TWF730_010164 [Orbilia blumenaviensis]|uniref:C2H2-type domain-containing protein n=1 Tax=Orbilia blumenaviensis TaxID=1796055 RepID=A0AAV9UMG2_9PEZI
MQPAIELHNMQGEGKVPSAVSLPWDFCKRFTAEEVAWLFDDGYSYEPHANDTLLFFRADERKRWEEAPGSVLDEEVLRLGFLRGDSWLPRYKYELRRYGRTLMKRERDEALRKGDLFRWAVGPESRRVLEEAKELLTNTGGGRSETGKRKRETARVGNPDPEYRPAAPEAKRRKVAHQAASKSVQHHGERDFVMTDRVWALLAPNRVQEPAERNMGVIPRKAPMKGQKREREPDTEVPERRKRTRKAATEPAEAPEAQVVAPAAAPAAVPDAGQESCGWRENDGSVCGSVFSNRTDLQNHVLGSHVPARNGLPQGQSNWLCRFGRCAHTYDTSRKESGVYGKADTLKSHIRFLLDVREFECRFKDLGCPKRWNRLNDMNTHAKRCKFNPEAVRKKKPESGTKKARGGKK